jgi:dolichol-phosphate hexosyltransferase
MPTLNEVEGLPATLDRVPFDELRRRGYDVAPVIVDGASTDGTVDVAQRRGVRVLTEPRKGYGRAYKTGLPQSDADIIVTADADDTYPLDALPDLLDRFVQAGLDFVTINRLAEMQRGSMRPLHRFGNFVLTMTARILYGVALRDSQSGMWLLTRRAVEALPLERMHDGMPFSQELKLRAFRHRGLRAAEWPGRYYVRVGEVKLASWRDGMRNLWGLLRHRFTRG